MGRREGRADDGGPCRFRGNGPAVIGLAFLVGFGFGSATAIAQTTNPGFAYAPGGGLTLSDGSGANGVSMQGLYTQDGGFFSGGTPRIEDGNEIRDAIINVIGTIAKHWSFQFAYDFADQSFPPETPFKNVTVSYTFGETPLIVTAGNQKVPFSQQHLNPIPQLVFAERALPFAIAPRRRLGLSAGWNGDRWQMLAGVYATNMNEDFDIDDRSYAVRATWGPELGPETMIHLGTAIEIFEPNDRPVAFGFPPETLLPERPLVATGPLSSVDFVRKHNFEIGGQHGPLTIQSELHVADLEGGSNDDAIFTSGYVQASFILTGERRPYIVANGPMLRGVFGRPKVENPVDLLNPLSSAWGAFEVAARFSASDLRSNGVGGGDQWEGTLGLNWFLNRSLRLTVNYIHTETDEFAGPDETADALLLRSEVRF